MHYKCEGECGGTAEQPDTCGSNTCTYKDKAFSECGCQDGQHDDKENKDTPSE